MQTYLLVNCNASSIELPLQLSNIGFDPESVYHLYFLDHAKEQDDANVLELIVLPFDWKDISTLYSLTIRLKNVPHATAHAAEVLYQHGIDIKTTSATDSIAGKRGSLETVVCSPSLDLEGIDRVFAEAYAGNTNDIQGFVEPTGFETGLGTTIEGRYLGKFVVGSKYINDWQSFVNKVVASDKVKIKRADGNLALDLPTDLASKVADYLNLKYGKPEGAPLSDYYAALTVNTAFGNLSISFLNPNESIVQITMIVVDKKGVFNAISDFLGRKQVNFRIVQLKNIEIGRRMRVELKCDLGSCDYHLLSPRTLRLALLADLRAAIQSQSDGVASDLLSLQIRPLYGYPKHLRNFDEDKLFDIIDLYYLKAGHKGITHKLQPTYDGTVDMAAESVAERLAELWSESSAAQQREKAFIESVLDVFTTQGARLGESSIPLADTEAETSHIEIFIDGKCYWLNLGDLYLLCLVFINTPPRNLNGKFFDARFFRLRHHLSRKSFDSLCRELLQGLTYGFPSQAEFDAFGELPAEGFVASAITRFSELGERYIEEKYKIDEFPILGNQFLSFRFRDYLLHSNGSRGSLSLLDIGPGVGALTSLFAVREMEKLGSMARLELSMTLLDVSAEVLEYCKTGRFHLPDDLREEYFAGFELSRFRQLLNRAETIVADASSALPERSFDVILSGFALHHMNSASRKACIRKMCAALTYGGFVGIVDESLTYSQYLEYLANHLRDEVQVAQESFVQDLSEILALFDECGVDVKHAKRDRFYCIWGTKRRRANDKETTLGELATQKRPTAVIFSSKEGIDIARKVRQSIYDDVEATLWSQGPFVLGSTAIESLEQAMSSYDFAIFIFSPDDVVDRRGELIHVVRDNVLFELGLFIGRISRSKAFIVKPTEGLTIPSDLGGLNVAHYDPNRELTNALSRACDEIRDALRNLGLL